jgi:hypothetical protein
MKRLSKRAKRAYKARVASRLLAILCMFFTGMLAEAIELEYREAVSTGLQTGPMRAERRQLDNRAARSDGSALAWRRAAAGRFPLCL